MAAARLAGLSRGNQQNGFIPVSRVADKAHGGAVSIGGGANAVASARLGFVRNAEKFPQQAFPPDVVKHLQGIEAFPRPIFNPVALGLLRQGGHSLVGGSDQQLVVVFVGRWQPLRWPIGQDFLQKGSSSPAVQIRLVSKERLEDGFERGDAESFEKGSF